MRSEMFLYERVCSEVDLSDNHRQTQWPIQA
jgi:hypothetical protein